MTPANLPNSAVRSQQSILTLDKSDEPFPTQLVKAATILGLDLDQQWKDVISSKHGQKPLLNTTSDPRHVYALRWLLKKLRCTDALPCGPRFCFKSWVLLRELLVRVPIVSVARMLKEHGFTSTLAETLRWLQDNSQQGQLSLLPRDDSISDLSEHDSGGESSSNDRTTARKRKADGIEIIPSESRDGPVVVLDTLYIALCGVMRELQLLSVDAGSVHGHATEHLKFALKCSPEQAASILGSSLYVVNHIIQSPKRNRRRNRTKTATFKPRKKVEETGFETFIAPMIEFWNFQTYGRGDESEESSSRFFLSHCLLSSLHLLETFQEWPYPSFELESLKQSLEDLLVDLIIKPFRTSFENTKKHEQQEVLFHNRFKNALADSLRTFSFRNPQLDLRADAKTKTYLCMSSLSLLFQTALKRQLLVTLSRHKVEVPWLDAFFVQILACASDIVNPLPSSYANKDLVRLIQWTMHGATEVHVKFSIPTLKSVLDKASRLNTDESDESGRTQVEWSVASLCLQNDPDVFVVSSSIRNQGQSLSNRLPNSHLAALLNRMTEDSCKMAPSLDDEYGFKLQEVIIPLLNAFSNVRDLTGFIALWKGQLAIVQSRRDGSPATIDRHSSIWEDDEVLRAVADHAEADLTIGQVESILGELRCDLESGQSQTDVSLPKDTSLPAIVIVDCLYFGCCGERTLSTLTKSAQQMYHTLARNFVPRPDVFHGYEWRLWRIMAVINDRWHSELGFQALTDDHHTAITKAMELLVLEDSGTSQKIKSSNSEKLQALNFTLSLAVLTYIELPNVSIRQTIVQAVKKVLKFKAAFCHQIREDHFGMSKLEFRIAEWTGYSCDIQSVDALHIACIARIVGSTNILDPLDSDCVEHLLEQLYWLAISERRSERKSPDQKPEAQCSYTSLWQALLRSSALEEVGHLARIFRKFQTTHFLKMLGSRDPRYWDIDTPQFQLTFESIQQTPLLRLKKTQRIEIANHVLRILLYKRVISVERLTEYIDLLAKITEYPNKSITILNNVSGISADGTDEGQLRLETSNFEPALIVIADKINEAPWVIDHVVCLDALRRLTKSVMRCSFANLSEGGSVQYLKVFYGWLCRAFNEVTESSQITVSRSVVMEVALSHYAQHRNDVPNSMKRELESLDGLRQQHLQSLIEYSDSALEKLSEPKFRHAFGIILKCMVSYSDLLCIHPDLRSISVHLAASLNQVKVLKDEDRNGVLGFNSFCGATEYLRSRLSGLEYALGRLDETLHQSFLNTPKQLSRIRSPQEKANLFRSFKASLSTLSAQQKNGFLLILISSDLEKGFRKASLEVLRQVLVSVNSHEAEELRTTISQVFLALCKTMLRADDPHTTIVSMQCLNDLLQRNPKVVSQCHVDNLIASIAIKASQFTSIPESKHTALGYVGLCRLFKTILVLHRPKIGGRYHLLLPALQSLLRCLFTPYTATATSTHHLSLVHFNSSHISAYTRLLTTLTDPSVSSVSGSKKGSRLGLNDETKKARSIAGQHLPYLIMEYCECQLKGRLSPEMKTALEPGLFAVMSVMTMEGMRTMNAALDESGRAVWKALYEDWKRLGR